MRLVWFVWSVRVSLVLAQSLPNLSLSLGLYLSGVDSLDEELVAAIPDLQLLFEVQRWIGMDWDNMGWLLDEA